MTRSGAQWTMVAITAAVLVGVGISSGVFAQLPSWQPHPRQQVDEEDPDATIATDEDIPDDMALLDESELVAAGPVAEDEMTLPTQEQAPRRDPEPVPARVRTSERTPERFTQRSSVRTTIVGSVRAPMRFGRSEEEEFAMFRALAQITPEDALSVAMVEFPGGSAKGVTLTRDQGFLVYNVELTDRYGRKQQVKVDAGNGDVLRTRTRVYVGEDESGRPH